MSGTGALERLLDGAPPPVGLPADHPRASTPAGVRPAAEGGSGRGRARRHVVEVSAAGVTAEPPGPAERILALAALAMLLRRYTGERDLVLGLTRRGRVTVVRVRIDPDGTVGDLLDAVDRAVTRGEEAGAVAVADLLAVRSAGASTGAPTGAPTGTPGVPACHGALLLGHGAAADCPAGLADLAAVLGPGPRVALTVPAALFSADSAARFARHYANLLSALVAEVEFGGTAAVREISPLDPAERAVMLHGWNDTAEEVPAPFFHELVEAVAARSPGAPAVVRGEERVTYGELDGDAERLAGALAALGAGAGGRVAVCLPRSAAGLAAQLAAFKLGAAAVLLDPDSPDDRLRFMLTDSAAAALVTTAATAARLDPPCPVVPVDDPGWRRGRPGYHPRGRVTAESVCHIAYTSGSTGVPKAVLLRHGPLRNTVHVLRRRCGITARSRGSWLSSPGYGMVEVDCFPLLAAGGSVHIPDPEVAASPARLRDWLVAERITQALVLTPMAERLWRLPWPETGRLCWMRIAGERLRTWPPAGLPYGVLNVYGSAEATVVATCDLTALAGVLPARRRERLAPPIGSPVANVRAYVLDDELEPVPPGVAGELYVSGASLSEGYLNRPDASGARFLPNRIPGDPYPVLYRSGDVARYWPDGTIEVVGRTDHEVKIRGYRVHLGEVESVLAAQPGVRQCAVLAREDEPGERRLVAYVEPVPAAPPAVAELRRALAAALPPYMRPAAYVVGELPANRNGKIDRAALPPPGRDRSGLGSAYREPRTDTERRLARLWARVLGVEAVGVDDDLLELGADSLRAVELVEAIRVEFGVELGLAELYGASTVAGCAGLLAPVPAPAGAVRHDRHRRHLPAPLTAEQVALAASGAGCYLEWEREWLDVEQFLIGWDRLVARHDALRTVLGPAGTQVVLPLDASPGAVVRDLTGPRPDAARAALLRTRTLMVAGMGEAGRIPLYELRLSLLPGERARIHLAVHGLVADVPSIAGVVVPELAAMYADGGARLPAVDITFADCVRSLACPELALPAGSGSGSGAGAGGDGGEPWVAVPPYRLDRHTWAALRRYADRRGVSPSAVLVTVLEEVLGRPPGEGSGPGGRRIGYRGTRRTPAHPRIEAVVGPFARTVPVPPPAAPPAGEGRRGERALSRRAREIHRFLDHPPGEAAGGSPAAESRPPVVVTDLLAVPGPAGEDGLGEPVYWITRGPGAVLDVRLAPSAGLASGPGPGGSGGTVQVALSCPAGAAGRAARLRDAFRLRLERILARAEVFDAGGAEAVPAVPGTAVPGAAVPAEPARAGGAPGAGAGLEMTEATR